MGMSMHVLFLRERDEKFKKMLAIKESCEKADIPLPKEVATYFQDSDDPDAALEIDARKVLREYRADMQEGYELDVKDIPSGCVRIRFVASY